MLISRTTARIRNIVCAKFAVDGRLPIDATFAFFRNTLGSLPLPILDRYGRGHRDKNIILVPERYLRYIIFMIFQCARTTCRYLRYLLHAYQYKGTTCTAVYIHDTTGVGTIFAICTSIQKSVIPAVAYLVM